MWVKIDDRFATHPKIVGLSDGAFRAHVTAICYAGGHLTDGFVPAAVALGLGRKHVAECVRAGLWDECPTGYQLHDFLDYNPPRERVMFERESAKRRRNVGRTSGDAGPNVIDPVPVPEVQVKDLAPNGAEMARWLQANGLSGVQNRLVAKLGGTPDWIKATNAAKQKFPGAVVTTALGHLTEYDGDWENPYAALVAECKAVAAKEPA